MKTMKVVSAKNPVPMEENSRRYITDQPVEVDLTSYYRRRLQAGELKEYVAVAAPKSPPKPQEK